MEIESRLLCSFVVYMNEPPQIRQKQKIQNNVALQHMFRKQNCKISLRKYFMNR